MGEQINEFWESVKDFWESAPEAENIAMLERLAKLRKEGVDVEKELTAILQKEGIVHETIRNQMGRS